MLTLTLKVVDARGGKKNVPSGKAGVPPTQTDCVNIQVSNEAGITGNINGLDIANANVLTIGATVTVTI